MPDFSFLKKLFAEGISKAKFIEEYSRAVQTTNEKVDASIFGDNTEVIAGGLFDMLNTNKSTDGKEDVLDLEEINRFANLSTADGENNMTEQDMNVLLSEYRKKVKEEYPIDTPEKMYEKATSKTGFNGDSAGTFLTALHFQISDLESLITLREFNSNQLLIKYNNEMNELVQEDGSISTKLKSAHQKETNKQNSLIRQKAQFEAEIKRKEQEITETNNECINLQANIDYAKENDKDSSGYSKELSSAQSKLSKLNDNLGALKDKYSKTLSAIDNSNKKLASLKEEMSSQSVELKSKMQEIDRKIELEKNACKQDIENYNLEKTSLESAQAYAVSQIQAQAQAQFQSTASVGNGDDTYIYDEANYDANAVTQLEQKWAKKAKSNGLDHKFFVKVTAIAKDLKCSPDDLLAVMNSESGINASARNPHGGATGLIQFMPSTAKSLGTTTDNLKNMSAYDQLDYVAKYLKNTKRSAGMGDKSMSAADVYSLIFLPGRANRDILTSSNETYYKWNTGLDMDGDGNISKADLNRRIRKFAA